MGRFILRRVLFGLLVLIIISFIVFVLFFATSTPEETARNFAGRQATPQQVANIQERLGLNRPFLAQYLTFANQVFLHFNFGTSFLSQTPVRELLLSRLPVTASLAIGAAIIWLAIGIPIGVLAATKPRSFRDRAATTIALIFYSIPTFVLGLMLLYIFFYRFNLAGITFFPGSGYVPFKDNPQQWFRHLILPWFTLAAVSAAAYSRLTRGSLLETLGEDYIRTARAKGLSERRVVYRHGLRSALTPIITVLGIDLGSLLGGAIVTEQVFGLPGIGALSVQAVFTNDLPVVLGTVLFAAFFIVVANIVVDIMYAVLDPRVRLELIAYPGSTPVDRRTLRSPVTGMTLAAAQRAATGCCRPTS